MLVKNLRHRAKLFANSWRLAARFDVLLEPATTVKYIDTIRFGRKCTVQSGSYIYGSPAGLEVVFGDMCVVASNCMVLGTGGLTIGDYTHLGPNVVITTQYGDSRTDPCVESPTVQYAAVSIGSGCWLGSGCVIMPGTELGDRCVVAPNSVVFGRWPAGTKLSGNPARRIKY